MNKNSIHSPQTHNYRSIECRSVPEQSQNTTFHQRFKKMEDPLPFTKKAISQKKHYPYYLSQLSQIKFIPTFESPKFQSSHDKLNTNDILGASPDLFQNQVFKNRIYGKKIDRQHIFSKNAHTIDKRKQEDIPRIKIHLPQLYTEELLNKKNNNKQQEKTAEHMSEPYYGVLNIDHVVNIKLPGRQSEGLQNKKIRDVRRERRIKTEIDNPESFRKIELNIDSRQMRRWSPTFITDTSNPLILKQIYKFK